MQEEKEIEKCAGEIMKTGIKEKDACHVACAVVAQCNYFITTDDRLLKYHLENLELVTPGEFIRRMETDYE